MINNLHFLPLSIKKEVFRELTKNMKDHYIIWEDGEIHKKNFNSHNLLEEEELRKIDLEISQLIDENIQELI